MGSRSNHQFLPPNLRWSDFEGFVHNVMEPNRQEHGISGLGTVSPTNIEESQPNPTPAVRRPRKQSNPKKYIAKPTVPKPRRKTASFRATQTDKTTQSKSTQTDNLNNTDGLIEVYMENLMVIRGYGPGYVVLRTSADGDETMEYFLG